MKKQDFLRGLTTAAEFVNCPYIAREGFANEEIFNEMGIRFSSSIFIMFHDNKMGHNTILVCFDENDNVVAAKVGNPTQSFISTLNILKTLYGAKIKSYKESKFESNKLIFMLE